MITREEAKMFFDNDTEVLRQAFESDIELAKSIQEIIIKYVSKIFEVFVLKGILTEEEALEHLKEVNKMLEEEKEKEREKRAIN